MTNKKIEQAVRKVVGTDASPRTVQPLVEAVKRFGPEWLKTYQQNQQRQPATSQQRITLNWADVEAWVKSNLRTNTNRRGGYYTECPVPTHKTDDFISVWDGDDHIGLKCFGDCTYRDMLEAIAKAIKTSAPPDTKPPETTVRPHST
ncbi:MAG: hypothetical protein OXU67_07380, partial [Chloroflexota bacterium]|nr:hypothetical protein [Chloroflexota bacterium]